MSVKEKITHHELVERARVWLLKNGHPIVVTEIASAGEEPDALGCKNGQSTLIECKTSRSDFLADKKKSFRNNPSKALGDYRYYCAPKGVITPHEIPENWGLLETCGERLITSVRPRPPAISTTPKNSHRNEIYILMSIIRRIGQTNPKGVSIRCYTYETQNRATLTVYSDINEV